MVTWTAIRVVLCDHVGLPTLNTRDSLHCTLNTTLFTCVQCSVQCHSVVSHYTTSESLTYTIAEVVSTRTHLIQVSLVHPSNVNNEKELKLNTWRFH